MPPWARHAAAVLGEHDGAGRYRYGIGVILVPRQSAKTTTALDLALGRGLMHRDYRAAYAAQTGHVTTERMGDRVTELVASPLEARLKVRRSQGTERVTVTSSGSYVKAFPPISGALRSSALDLVIVDEGQEHDDEPLGVALDHTIFPTFTTRPRRQFLILGTAPDRPGTMLGRYAERARAGTPGWALFDYGADPDTEDLDSPETWQRRHPGLAAGLTDLEFLTDQWRLDREGFYREHLNVYSKGTPGGVVDLARFAALEVDAPPRAGRVALGVEASPQGAGAAVVAAWPTPGGGVHCEVVATGEGTSWLAETVADLTRRHRADVVAFDGTSVAAGALRPILDRLPARSMQWAEVAAACQWFTEAHAEGAEVPVTHTPDLELSAAAAAAVRRTHAASGRWAYGRRAGGDPVAPLAAATWAAYAVHAPATSRPRARVRGD